MRLGGSLGAGGTWLALALPCAVGCVSAGGNQAPRGPAEFATPTTIVGPNGVEDIVELLARADQELRQEHYREAAALYQRAFDNDLASTYRTRALLGWGSALDLASEHARALATYERLLGLQKAGFERDATQIRSVRLLTYLERYAEAEARARSVEPAGRAPLEQVALYAARALGALERGADADAERDLSRAQAAIDPLGLEHLDRLPLDFGALSFARGELLRRRASLIVFEPMPSDFAATLERRCELLLRAQAAYSDAMRAQSAHYSAMSGVRVGQLYQDLHLELMRMPPPVAARTPAQKQLVEGALRLRYAVLLDTAGAMLSATVQMVARTGEGQAWAQKAETALQELRKAQREEEQALAALPYSRADLEKALRDLSERARSATGQ